MKTWKTLNKKTVLNHSKFLRVDEHEVELPDGRVIKDWPVVITPDYVNILACDRDGKFLCFRQNKYIIPGMFLSAPGGYLEPGEDSLIAARRELREETGYESDEWIDLGHFVVDANRGCGNAHLYLALNAKKTAPLHADDLEDQHPELLSREELEKELDRGGCPVLAWTTLFVLGLRYLDQKKPPSTRRHRE